MILRIAIQAKGRLFEETMEMLGETGIKLKNTRRTLLVKADDFPVEVLFLRDDDIPQAVATGVADVGIVGENEFVEKNEDAIIAKRLGFSKCRLSLAIPKDIDYQNINWFAGKKIATSYPHILTSYLKDQQIEAEIHEITGSVEISPSIGLSDAIFDIVSSGATLVSNRLKEVEVVMKSEALLIKYKGLDADKQAILDELIFRIEAVQAAYKKKYIMLNAPEENVQKIIDILPGIKSPTVTTLAEKGWCSIQSVVEEKRFWDIISKLKGLGAEGILVLPIEKMIL